MEKESRVHFVFQRGCLQKAALQPYRVNFLVQLQLMNNPRFVDSMHGINIHTFWHYIECSKVVISLLVMECSVCVENFILDLLCLLNRFVFQTFLNHD